MKYKVKVEYRGSVTVEVDAETETEAEYKAIDEADEHINGCLTVYDVKITSNGGAERPAN